MEYKPELHKLSNGIPVLLDPMDLASASMAVNFESGSRDEEINEYGIMHFCEHMLGKGTKRFPSSRALVDYIQDNSGTCNASTSPSNMRVYGRILAEKFPVLIDFLADEINNSLFDNNHIEIERDVILDELKRSLDNRGRQFDNFITGKIFAGSHMLEHNLGTQESLKSFSRDQLITYLKNHTSSKRTIITVSGNFGDKEILLKKLDEYFSYIPALDLPDNSGGIYHKSFGHNPWASQKQILLTIALPSPFDYSWENRINNIKMTYVKRILSVRLFESLRNKNGLVYDIGTGTFGDEKISAYSIDCQTSPENLEKCVTLVAKICKEFITSQPPTETELKRQFAKCDLGDADWLESPSDRMKSIISFYRDWGKLRDQNEDKIITDMNHSLKAEDILWAAKQFFNGETPSIFTQGPEHNLDLQKIWNDNF